MTSTSFLPIYLHITPSPVCLTEKQSSSLNCFRSGGKSCCPNSSSCNLFCKIIQCIAAALVFAPDFGT